MTSHYDWFADWVENHVLLTLVAAKGPDAASLLAAFGPAVFDQGDRTLQEVLGLSEPTVRIGTTTTGWAYSVETLTVRGGAPDFLQQVSSDGGEAFSLCFTPTISSFLYARDGALVNGFDITGPQFRFGNDEHAFDRQMHAAGLLTGEGPRPKAAVASFVAQTFGLSITRDMLEARLPCATLGPVGG